MTSFTFKLRVSSRDTPSAFALLDRLPSDKLRRTLVLASWVQRGIDLMSIGTVTVQSPQQDSPVQVRHLRLSISSALNPELSQFFSAHPNKAQSRWVLFYLELGAGQLRNGELYLPPMPRQTLPSASPPAEPDAGADSRPATPSQSGTEPVHNVPADQIAGREEYPADQEIDANDLAAIFS